MPTVKLTNEEFTQKFNEIRENISTMPGIVSQLAPTLISHDADDMSFVCSFETADWMSNPANHVHGGITATISDNAMGCLCSLYNSRCFTPTISMNMNYLAPVPACSTLFVEAKITKLGRSIIYTTAKIWLAGREENPAVTATAVYAATDKSFI